jgi:hypothetical protein
MYSIEREITTIFWAAQPNRAERFRSKIDCNARAVGSASGWEKSWPLAGH